MSSQKKFLDPRASERRTIRFLIRGTRGAGGWAITPKKIDHSLKGRKNIVQLAKIPPSSKI